MRSDDKIDSCKLHRDYTYIFKIIFPTVRFVYFEICVAVSVSTNKTNEIIFVRVTFY